MADEVLSARLVDEGGRKSGLETLSSGDQLLPY